jgi:hypothetical protein
MIPAFAAHIGKHEKRFGIISGSAQFGHCLQLVLNLDGIIRSCPLVPASSFPFSSWDCVPQDWPDWGYQLQPKRLIFDLFWTRKGAVSQSSAKRLLWGSGNGAGGQLQGSKI